MANAAAVTDDRMKVYVSYARADAGFADQLCAFLEEAGFRALSDREEIAAADFSRQHLSDLISSAETLIVVLTDAAARSQLCGWEVEEAHRLGKRVIPVLPNPLHGGVPAELAEGGFVRFYVDPASPQSGFFDGQKRLITALCADLELADTAPAGAGVAELRSLRRELKKARDALARIKRDERSQRRTQMAPSSPYPPLPPIGYDRPPPRPPRPRSSFRFPWLRGGFLLLVGAWVIGFFVSGDVRAKTQSIGARAAEWMQQVYAATEPPRPHGVSADDFTPTREASTGANGANVRDYPLPHADLLTELPAHAPLHITGRLNVQGNWWFRVVLSDGRIGFVHQDAIAWGRAIAATPPQTQQASATTSPAQSAPLSQPSRATQVAGITAFDPAILAEAGHAGAKIRTSPARNGRVIVRIARGADVTLIGRRRAGGHWWYWVRLEDGREGYARDDVLTARGGGRLRV